MRHVIAELEEKETAYKAQIEQLSNLEEVEQHVRYMEQQLDLKEKEISAIEQYVAQVHEEKEALKVELNGKSDDSDIIKELNCALEANKRLTEDINRERVMRKKYFNAIEVLKGKIRVYCRLRPLNSSEKIHNGTKSVADVVDPYTVLINTLKGPREFNFDRVFLPNDSQETVFQDTHVRHVSIHKELLKLIVDC